MLLRNCLWGFEIGWCGLRGLRLLWMCPRSQSGGGGGVDHGDGWTRGRGIGDHICL